MFNIFKLIADLISENTIKTNPANGLPMLDSTVDIEGNPFGFSNYESFSSNSFDSNSFSSFD